MTTPKTILLSIPDGFAARFLLRSGVLASLKADGHRLVILSPNADEQYFQQEFADNRTFLRPLVRWGGRVHRRLYESFELLWQTMTWHPGIEEMIRQEIERAKTKSWLTFLFLKTLRKTFGGNRGVIKLLSWIDQLLFPGRSHRQVFEEFHPDLLVVTTYGFDPGDLYLMRQARRKGVRILYVVMQWDNTSTRPGMREIPDKVVAWNEHNRHELVEFYGYPERNIYVAGPAHFDVYAHPETFSSWEDYCRRMGMDPSRRLIVLAGTTPEVTDGVDDIVRFLGECIEQGRFVMPCQLLIRPHPIGFFNGAHEAKKEFERYRSLSSHIYYDPPRMLSQVLKTDLDGRDSKHLAETLYHASVVLNFFSTINLDAAAVESPLVNIVFDGLKERDYYHSARRVADLWNNVLVAKSGGVRVASTFQELMDHINAYLRNPSLDAPGRARMVQEHCHRVDGQAAQRVARAISLYAQGRWILDEQPQEPSSPERPAALWKRKNAVKGALGAP